MIHIKRQSPFETIKDVHIKLQKETHTNLRNLMFRKKLSMQECFEEFSRLCAAEDPVALRILDMLIVKKFRAKLENTTKYGQKIAKLSELDEETLYSLLEDQSPLYKEETDE